MLQGVLSFHRAIRSFTWTARCLQVALLTVLLVLPVNCAFALTGDLDSDCNVDRDDLNILMADRNKPVADSTCGEACDLDGDGIITVLDARKLILLCTQPRCAIMPDSCTENQPPDGKIEPAGSITIYAGQSISFTGVATDPDGTVSGFLWDFGGGAPNVEVQNPTDILFSAPGTYTVTFTPIDDAGLSDPEPDTVVVNVLSPMPKGIDPMIGMMMHFLDQDGDGALDPDALSRLSEINDPQFIDVDAEGRIQLVLTLSSDLTEHNEDVLSARGIIIERKNSMRRIQVRVPLGQIVNLSALSFVEFVSLPSYAVNNSGNIMTQGDAVLGSDRVRNDFGLDGTGIKIGVISNGLGGLSQSQASGDLPNVTYKSFRSDGDIASGSEGTAMLEIVHDIAPGAELYFCNCNSSEDFIAAVDFMSLQDDPTTPEIEGFGLDIIIDDLAFINAGPYDGTSPVSEAVSRAVTLHGSRYFTVSANYAHTHYAGQFSDTDHNSFHEFNTSTRATTEDFVFILQANSSVLGYIMWDDPDFNNANSDFQPYLKRYDQTSRTFTSLGLGEINNNDLYFAVSVQAQLPELPIYRNHHSKYPNPTEWFYIKNKTDSDMDFSLNLRKIGGPDEARNFSIFFLHAELETYVPEGSVPNIGDAKNVISVGAVPWSSPGEREYFSSYGPTWDGRQKPELVATDRVCVTGNGGFGAGPDNDCQGSVFAGTSATSPHVGAVAALMLQANPGLSHDDIKQILQQTAVDIEAPGLDQTSGYGRINAYAAVQAAVAAAHTLQSIEITNADFTLTQAGATQQLSVTGHYSDGSQQDLTPSNSGTTYQSSDPQVATVSAEGMVSAVGNGVAVITASNSGSSDTVQVTVTIPVVPVLQSIDITNADFTLTQAGATQQLNVTGHYSDGSQQDLTSSNTGTTYQSSAPQVATVSAEGLVSAVGNGVAVITASNSGSSDTVQVTVTISAPMVFISADPQTIALGESSTLTWQAVNAESVTISGIGQVSSIGSLDVFPKETTIYTITATGPERTDTDSVMVRVIPPVTADCYEFEENSPQLDTEILFSTGERYLSFTYTPGPDASTDVSFELHVNGEYIAKVDSVLPGETSKKIILPNNIINIGDNRIELKNPVCTPGVGSCVAGQINSWGGTICISPREHFEAIWFEQDEPQLDFESIFTADQAKYTMNYTPGPRHTSSVSFDILLNDQELTRVGPVEPGSESGEMLLPPYILRMGENTIALKNPSCPGSACEGGQLHSWAGIIYLFPGGKNLKIADFDLDPEGHVINEGDDVSDTYHSWGIHFSVFDDIENGIPVGSNPVYADYNLIPGNNLLAWGVRPGGYTSQGFSNTHPLLITFDHLTNFVQFDVIDGDHVIAGDVDLYDEDGTLLEHRTFNQSGRDTITLFFKRAQKDIKYLIFAEYGSQADGADVDNIAFFAGSDCYEFEQNAPQLDKELRFNARQRYLSFEYLPGLSHSTDVSFELYLNGKYIAQVDSISPGETSGKIALPNNLVGVGENILELKNPVCTSGVGSCINGQINSWGGTVCISPRDNFEAIWFEKKEPLLNLEFNFSASQTLYSMGYNPAPKHCTSVMADVFLNNNFIQAIDVPPGTPTEEILFPLDNINMGGNTLALKTPTCHAGEGCCVEGQLHSWGGIVYLYPGSKDLLQSVDITNNDLYFTDTTASEQLVVMGHFPHNATIDLSSGDTGTIYRSSNPEVATVSADGLVTAVSTGAARITAVNNKLSDTILVIVAVPEDSFVPMGTIATDGEAKSLAVYNDYAYVCGTENVTIVDISDPLAPEIVTTFDVSVDSDFIECRIKGEHLLVGFSGSKLNIYSLNNPEQPALLGSTDGGYAWLSGSFIQDNYAYLNTNVIAYYTSSGQIVWVRGDLLAFDFSDASNPALVDVLYDTHGPYSGGDYYIGEGAAINDHFALIPSTTASGSDTQSGVGRILVVDITDPSNLSIVRELQIPETILLNSVAIEGDLALVAGSTGGFANPITPGTDSTGNLTLTTIDITEPQNPLIIGTTVMEGKSSPWARIVPAGNGFFALSHYEENGHGLLMMVDTKDPANLAVLHETTSALITEMQVVEDKLYTTSTSGLGIYYIGGIIK